MMLGAVFYPSADFAGQYDDHVKAASCVDAANDGRSVNAITSARHGRKAGVYAEVPVRYTSVAAVELMQRDGSE